MQTKLYWQSNRNGQINLKVPELMTIYLFGQASSHFTKRVIYDSTRHYWFARFPALLSYQAFARRLNVLESHFQSLLGYLLGALKENQPQFSTLDHLVDSMPMILASGVKSNRARVVREIAAVGFCATKQMDFHGVQLHLLARRRNKRLPVSTRVWVERDNTHDLTALRAQRDLPPNRVMFGDKAYTDRGFKNLLRLQNINLLKPIKKPKGGALLKTEKHFNELVSKIRQPIESFFKWLIDKTDIQRASLLSQPIAY